MTKEIKMVMPRNAGKASYDMQVMVHKLNNLTKQNLELLEALEGLVESCELFGRDVEDAKKAIAKAKGE